MSDCDGIIDEFNKAIAYIHKLEQALLKLEKSAEEEGHVYDWHISATCDAVILPYVFGTSIPPSDSKDEIPF